MRVGRKTEAQTESGRIPDPTKGMETKGRAAPVFGELTEDIILEGRKNGEIRRGSKQKGIKQKGIKDTDDH